MADYHSDSSSDWEYRRGWHDDDDDEEDDFDGYSDYDSDYYGCHHYYHEDESDEEEDEYSESEDTESNALDASKRNDLRTIQNLIRSGFDVNTKINYRTTCLHQAVENGHFEMVGLLLDSGAKIGSLDIRQYGPLHTAIQIVNRKTRWRMVQLLLKAGASVDDRNHSYKGCSYNTTCIHEAVKINDFDLVLYFLSAGAKINCFDKPTNTNNSVTPLQAAMLALKGRARYKMVKKLIEAGADVKLCHNGQTCLHTAISQKQCRWELVKLLIDAGAEINCVNELSYSPLSLAAQLNQLSLVRNLIHAGADVNIPKSCFRCPLAFAAQKGHKSVVDMLLKNGADVNARDESGRSILHNVVSRVVGNCVPNKTDILRMFLANGAIMVSSKFGRYVPFKSLLQQGDIEDINSFIEYGLDLKNCGVRFPIHEAAINKKEKVLRYLLSTHLFDVDEINDGGSTALMIAVTDGITEHVRSLIEWGANVDCLKEVKISSAITASRTPLDLAISMGKPKLVKLLLAAGARIDLSLEDPDVLRIVQSAVMKSQITTIHLNYLIAYLALFKSQGCRINKSVKNYLKTNVRNLSKLMSDCKKELGLLKTVVFYKHVTFYDLLLGKDITRLTSNLHAKEQFESLKVDERFPYYGEQIKEHYSLNVFKRELMNLALKGLRRIFRYRFCGDEIFLNIMTQLSIKDLRNLCVI